MDVLLEQLPVDNETKAVLLGQNSSLRPAVSAHAGPGIGRVGAIEQTGKTIEIVGRGSCLDMVAGDAVGARG